MCLPLLLGVSFLLTDPEFCGVVRGARYGEIHIVGNTDTPRRVILPMLCIEAGGKIQLGRLQAARKRLQECPTLRTEIEKGIEPIVILEPNKDSVYWDVLVTVQDARGSWLGYELVDLAHFSLRALVFRDWMAGYASLSVLEYIAERIGRE